MTFKRSIKASRNFNKMLTDLKIIHAERQSVLKEINKKYGKLDSRNTVSMYEVILYQF